MSAGEVRLYVVSWVLLLCSVIICPTVGLITAQNHLIRLTDAFALAMWIGSAVMTGRNVRRDGESEGLDGPR